MTLVEIDLVLPNGNPLVNAPFTILPSKADFTDSLTGVVMPRLMELTTDALGKASVSLWPNEVPYFLEAVDTASEAVIFYKFIVPVVPPNTSVRLQDIVAEGAFSDTYYDAEAIAIIHAAKLSAKASELAAIAAAATAVAAANGVSDVSADVAEVRTLAGQVQTNATSAAANATSASASASQAAASASSASSAAGSAASATASAASATASEAAALASRNEASGFATTASTGASTATTKAGEAATSAAASAASAAVAAGHAENIGNIIGNPVSSVNGRSGAVVINATDISTGLGFTPQNPANPASVSTVAVGLQTARTLTLGATGKPFDGTANVTWTLAEMGISAELPTLLKTVNGVSLAGSGNVDVGGSVTGLLKSNGAGLLSAAVAGTDYVVPSGSITGNASTANRLTTPRNINGVPFDGTADITMPMLGSWWGEPIVLTVLNNNALLAKNRTYHLNSQGGAFLIHLPELLPGDWVKLIDIGYVLASNNVTIGRAGQLIRNAPLDLILDVSGDSVELVGTSTGVIEQ